MIATRRAVLIAPLALGAVAGLTTAALVGNAGGFALIEEGAAPAAQTMLMDLARRWFISETVRVPHRTFIDLGMLKIRLTIYEPVRLVALARTANRLLCQEALRDAGGVVLYETAAPGNGGYGLLAARKG